MEPELTIFNAEGIGRELEGKYASQAKEIEEVKQKEIEKEKEIKELKYDMAFVKHLINLGFQFEVLRKKDLPNDSKLKIHMLADMDDDEEIIDIKDNEHNRKIAKANKRPLTSEEIEYAKDNLRVYDM